MTALHAFSVLYPFMTYVFGTHAGSKAAGLVALVWAAHFAFELRG